MRLTHATFQKTVASAGTAEALVASSTRARSAEIRALGTNTGNVTLALATGEEFTVAPGESYRLRVGQTVYDLADYQVDAAVDGEGVSVWYWWSAQTASVALESKIESAAVKLIDAVAAHELFDGVSVTAGLTTASRNLNAIVAYAPTAEQVEPGGQWRVTLEVSVRTKIHDQPVHVGVDGFHLHRSRTDAVRCLFAEKHTPQALAAVEPGLWCLPNSLHEGATLESEVDDEEAAVFVSRITIQFIAQARDL